MYDAPATITEIHLRGLAQLGQPDELLVEARVLLDLVAPARDLHLDPILLLILLKVTHDLHIRLSNLLIPSKKVLNRKIIVVIL